MTIDYDKYPVVILNQDSYFKDFVIRAYINYSAAGKYVNHTNKSNKVRIYDCDCFKWSVLGSNQQYNPSPRAFNRIVDYIMPNKTVDEIRSRIKKRVFNQVVKGAFIQSPCIQFVSVHHSPITPSRRDIVSKIRSSRPSLTVKQCEELITDIKALSEHIYNARAYRRNRRPKQVDNIADRLAERKAKKHSAKEKHYLKSVIGLEVSTSGSGVTISDKPSYTVKRYPTTYRGHSSYYANQTFNMTKAFLNSPHLWMFGTNTNIDCQLVEPGLYRAKWLRRGRGYNAYTIEGYIAVDKENRYPDDQVWTFRTYKVICPAAYKAPNSAEAAIARAKAKTAVLITSTETVSSSVMCDITKGTKQHHRRLPK